MKTILLAMVMMVTLVSQTARATFQTNDLYLGFTSSSAQDDYIIDLGQPATIGVGGTAVVDLSSQFSLDTFNSVFAGGAVGVNLAVVGGNNDSTFVPFDVYATAIRTGGAGTPSHAGSNLSTKTHSTTTMSRGSEEITTLMASLGGAPNAGSSAVDSSKSYSALLVTTSASSFVGTTGVNPAGTFGGSAILYLDLWTASTASPYTYLGYFTMDLSTATPSLTFTPSGTSGGTTPPVAGSVLGTVTNGFAPLTVGFTNTASGSITNWVWNFGNGTIITNTTGADVTNTYAASGSYNVSLSVYGPGGSSTTAMTSYIVVSPTPTFGTITLANGALVLSGANGPAGVPYRILSSTNLTLPLSSWIPVVTNAFLSDGTYAYTNVPSSSGQNYFVLVSP